MQNNNKEAASHYVAQGFKLCLVRGKEPFQKGWEKKPITDLNLFDHNGIGLIHGLSGTCTLDIDNIEHSQIALEAIVLALRPSLGSSRPSCCRKGRAPTHLVYRPWRPHDWQDL